MYRMMITFSRLEPLKINILLILSHIAPKRVSGQQLTYLLGLSQKARTIYRGVLDEMAEERLIHYVKVGKSFSIQLNLDHNLLKDIQEIVLTEGIEFTNTLLARLDAFHD